MSDLVKNNKREKRTVEEAERDVIELFAKIYAETIKAIEKKYHNEGFELVRDTFMKVMVDGWEKQYEGMEKRDLKTFVDWLLAIITSSAKYEIVEDKKDSVRLKFTECPWAAAFRKIGYPEIGKFFCDGDFPMVEAFNKKIKFERTKTLMEGDPYCDHHYYTEDEDNN